MKRNRKQNIRLLALILILLLGIGFAALAANLKIDGTVNVAKTSWDVHFENVSITQGSVTANPAPTSNNTDTTEMTYTINFTKPGDYFEFTTDIVNAGTIDAMVDVVSNNAYANASSTTPITLPSYLTSTVTYDDGVLIQQNQELLHGTSEKIKVRVEFKKDISVSDLPSSGDTTVVFKFKADYKQADDNAKPVKSVWTLPEGRTKDNLQVGDEICTGDQCFNFIKYEETDNDIVMLAKYNLKVGNIYDSGVKIGEYSSSDTGYGLQSNETRGYVPGETSYGTVDFSTTNYWVSDNNLISPFNENNTIYYDSSSLYFRYVADNSLVYPTIYDATNHAEGPGEWDEWGFPTNPNYSIAYYVEQYKNKLTVNYGQTIKNARLLTYGEVIDNSIGCIVYHNGDYFVEGSCPTSGNSSFITNTSYWLGSAVAFGNMLFIDSSGNFNNCYYNDGGDFYGVRPVIVVAKSNM